MAESVYCTWLLQWPCLNQQLWAAWIQAVGSIAAIGAAVWISRAQSKRALELAKFQGDQLATIERARFEREDRAQRRREEANVVRLRHTLLDIYFEADTSKDLLETMPRTPEDIDEEEAAHWKRNAYDALVTCELKVAVNQSEIAHMASFLDTPAMSDLLALGITIKDYEARFHVLRSMLLTSIVAPATIEATMDIAIKALSDICDTAEAVREQLAPDYPSFRSRG